MLLSNNVQGTKRTVNCATERKTGYRRSKARSQERVPREKERDSQREADKVLTEIKISKFGRGGGGGGGGGRRDEESQKKGELTV